MADVTTENRGSALWIRLNRPERRNAYDAEMAAAIVAALDGAAAMRSVVITGVDRSFCAGGSLASLSTPDSGAAAPPLPRIAALVRRDPHLSSPRDRCRQRSRSGRRERAGRGVRPGGRGAIGDIRADRSAGRQLAGHRRDECHERADRREAGQGAVDAVSPVLRRRRAADGPRQRCRRRRRPRGHGRGVVRRAGGAQPRYLEITKISSNVWWNAARDSFSTGLGMLVQAIGSADMVEGASAFLEKRRPRFPDPE